MEIHPTSIQEAAETGASHKGRVLFSDFTTAGNTQTLNLSVVKAKQAARLMFARLKTTFKSADAALLSSAITVGDSGSANRFLLSMELNDAAPVWLQGGVALNPIYNVYTVDDNLQVAMTNTAAKNVNTFTQGEVELFFNLVDAR